MLDNDKKKWYQTEGKNADTVISTRLRFARNLNGYPFPHLMSDAQKKEVIRKLKKDYDFKNIVYNDLGTVIMSHGGKGAMGVWFIRK